MENFELLSRVKVTSLEEVLGKPFKVLDDGFIRIIDYMGSDEAIVQAARVSYGIGTKKQSEDKALIRYLMRHMHTTPFEMCEVKLHIRVPMDCWRQWIRHRTASVNEYSTRYSLAIDSTQLTKPTEWRRQSEINKQGSGKNIEEDVGAILSKKEADLHSYIRDIYEERISYGVAREQARKDLSLSTYTEAYWKIDLHNLLHFLSLRMDAHAQFEIRSYAKTIGEEIVKRWCPIAWEAFNDYRINSKSFSSIELNVLRFYLNNEKNELQEFLIENKLILIKSDKITKSREFLEMENKFKSLNIDIDINLK